MHEGQIFNALIEFFEEDDWDFTWIDGMSVLRMGFSGKNGNWTCYAQAREAHEQFIFYSVCPINAPEHQRHLMAEFITRANYGMIIGNFELDYSDGEIRYKTSIDVEGATLLPVLTKQLVYANVVTTDRYLPGIMAVLYGGKSPEEAVALVENPTGASDDDDDLDDDDDDDDAPLTPDDLFLNDDDDDDDDDLDVDDDDDDGDDVP